MASPAGPDRRAPSQSPGLLSGGSCSGATRGRGPGDASTPRCPSVLSYRLRAALVPACGKPSFFSPPDCQVGRAGRTVGQEHRGLAEFCPDTCAVGAGTLTQARDHSRCGATAVQGGSGWTPRGRATRTLPTARGHTSEDAGRQQCGRLLAERLQLCSLPGWLAEKAQIGGLSEEPVEKAEAQARDSAGTLVSLAVSHLELEA